MTYKTFSLLALTTTSLFSCNNDEFTRDISQPIEIDFAQSDRGFTPLFSDYPQGEEAFYQLDASHQTLPEPFAEKMGWKLTGNNHSDDLLMTISAPIDLLQSNTMYTVSLALEFLTDVPQNCFGIGGAPGESVYVKLGVSDTQPSNTLDNDMYRITTDLGNQSQSGTQGQTVGDINNGIDCEAENAFSYTAKTVQTSQAINVMSDDNGVIWVIAGTDSGFEGYTSIYLTKLNVTISK
ncbi:hypothetical protein [Paraglaciecola sp.]|uniref:hypothetical protein n=1 Tax=Paraglaciecola sp. TaxID=1920173 RepID=UPI003EF6BAC9